MATAPDDAQSRPLPADTRPDGETKPGPIVVNGAYNTTTKPVSQLPHTVPAKPTPTPTPDALAQLPPEIQHITQGYQPLSKLFQRTAQLCFNNLTDIINSLADIPDGPQQNGNLSPSHSQSEGTSRENIHKKSQWLHFANSQRERFIKLLVLLQWSRRIDDISRAIDVGFFLNQRSQDFEDVRIAMGEIKREMESLRLPSPDIESALETLTTGKSSRMPDLGYIPPETLSSQRIRDIFREIDISLHVRINLHEDLPSYFSNYHIHSGRVTFVVPSEFEVDLFADQDPASPWYFIDLRFAFPNASEIPITQFWSQLEGFVNYALATKGLLGCYEFLHDFVLTHMINILRKKALRLARQSWNGSLRIDQMHRSLVLQYWKDRLHGKHWIEIGVMRGQGKSSYEASTSTIGVKWCRSSKEVADVTSLLNLSTLDIEAVLTTITHRHSILLLSGVRDKWLASQPHANLANVRLNESAGAVTLDFSSAERGWSVAIEPVCGEFRLLPPSKMARSYEQRMNELRQPRLDAAQDLTTWQVTETRVRVGEAVLDAGWKIQYVTLEVPSMRVFIGDNVHQYSLFQHKDWPESLSWYLLCTINASCEQSWSIIRTTEPEGHRRINAIITFLSPIREITSERDFMNDDRALAISSTVSACALTSFFNEQAIEFLTQDPPLGEVIFRIWLKLPQMAAQPCLQSRPAAHPVYNLEMTCPLSQCNTSHVSVPIELSGTVGRGSGILEVMLALKDDTLQVETSGRFCLRIEAAVGSTTSLEEALERLRRLSTLGGFVTALKSEGLQYEVDLSNTVAFSYGPAMPTRRLKARVRLARNGKIAISLSPPSNPHKHLLRCLIEEVRCEIERHGGPPVQNDMETLVWLLNLTLGPAKALHTIHQRKNAHGGAELLRCVTNVHINHVGWYTITYPQYFTCFDVNFYPRDDGYVWIIEHYKRNVPSDDVDTAARDQLQQALDVPLREQSAGKWRGYGTGILATRDGVCEALCRLDDIVRRHAPVAERLIWEPDPRAPVFVPQTPRGGSAILSSASTLGSSQTQTHTQMSTSVSTGQNQTQTQSQMSADTNTTTSSAHASQQASVNGPTSSSKKENANNSSAPATKPNGIGATLGGIAGRQQQAGFVKGGTSAVGIAAAGRGTGVMSNGNARTMSNTQANGTGQAIAGTSSVDAIEID